MLGPRRGEPGRRRRAAGGATSQAPRAGPEGRPRAHRALYSDRAEVKFCRAASADDDDDGASSKKKRSGPPPTHVAMVVVALATIATILFAGLCRAAKEPAAATKVVEMK